MDEEAKTAAWRWLRLKARGIAAYGPTPPSCNNLSNFILVRDAKFTELVFRRTPTHLQPPC